MMLTVFDLRLRVGIVITINDAAYVSVGNSNSNGYKSME